MTDFPSQEELSDEVLSKQPAEFQDLEKVEQQEPEEKLQ